MGRGCSAWTLPGVVSVVRPDVIHREVMVCRSPLTARFAARYRLGGGGTPTRCRAPLRVAVLGPPDLFADRTVDFLRGLGVDARRPGWPLGGNLRYRIERARRGLAADVVFHMSGRRELSGIQTWLARLGSSHPHPLDRERRSSPRALRIRRREGGNGRGIGAGRLGYRTNWPNTASRRRSRSCPHRASRRHP